MRSGIVDGLSVNVTVELLTGETIFISTVEGKTTTCSAIWSRIEGELGARGVVQPNIFGLAVQTGSDFVFVDPDAKLSKYFPKEWKSTPGSISNESKTLTLYCRVHFYLEALPQNFDVVSHLHYYLQLRENLIASPRRAAPASEINHQLVQPLAFAYQSEVGDWRPCQERPQWAKNLINLGSALTRAHQALTGLGQASARMAFMRAVMPQVNRHLYSMTLRTKDGKDSPVWIAVTPKGIEVYQSGVSRAEIPEQPKVTFLWANITKLYFERKKFEIRGKSCPCGGSTEKLTFTAPSESVPRHLLLLCRSTHQFSLSQHRLQTATTTTSTGSTGSTANMGNSSSSSTTGDSGCPAPALPARSRPGDQQEKMLDLSLWADGLLLTGESSEHQRVSVISNASSNTTSGIVSDRVYSLDGSEEELDMREISDCCTDRTHHTNNSTSLESLSQKHPPPPRPHHLSKPNVRNGRNIVNGSSPCAMRGNNSNIPPNENEAKYWYCDSDCEDCDDAAGTCRSLLVRTIGGKGAMNGSGLSVGAGASQCECNSCTATSAEDEIDGLDLPNGTAHQHTPSMVSEATLKAVDASTEEKVANASPGEDVCDGNVKNSVQTGGQRLSLGKDADDPAEHIYGEICEDHQKSQDDVQYSTIGNAKITERTVAVPQAATRIGKERRDVQMCKHKNSSNTKTTPATSATATAKKSDGLTPKIASLKCLRTRRVPPWAFSRKDDGKEGGDEADYGHEFSGRTAKHLTQGRYPSTRTVSDNFDTDSDYVQLPPLLPRLHPKKPTGNKLWKFVTSKAHKSCGNVHQLSLEDLERPRVRAPPIPPHNSSAGTVPRRKASATEYSHSVSEITKTSSRSCGTALNSLGLDGRPEPPPKPKKLVPGSELRTTQAVDARFIATKPQILIQTAYATPAPVAVSSQAQILFRGSKFPAGQLNPKGKSLDGNTVLYHSQSMDNIYDTVACEDSHNSRCARRTPGGSVVSTISKPRPQTPPPLYPKNKKTLAPKIPVVVLPNNYIDVHASGVTTRSKPPMPAPTTSQGIGSGKTIGMSRCESVPNNLNINFMIGLQNLKPLSRAPIVYPATNGLSGNARNNRNSMDATKPHNTNYHRTCVSGVGVVSSHQSPPKQVPLPNSRLTNSTTTSETSSNGPQQFTTVYTSQLSRSRIKQFKAELYSDQDYVIFPPKDPRVSQQEYFDSKGLSYQTTGTSTTGSTHSSYASMNDIPPPYLPPPPPYPIPGAPPTMTTTGKPSPALAVHVPNQQHHNGIVPLPPRNPGSQGTSYQSLYNALSSNASQCSSSQYGYYAIGGGSGGLNAENLQRFLSTQSLAGSSNLSAAPIYYPSSTHSAPPLPPYKNNAGQAVVENGMRKAVYQYMTNGMTSEERIRMKLCRSDDSLCSQSPKELQVMQNLPPPPPYHQKPIISPSEVDLVKLRAKCTALELPLLKALCSDGDLLTQTKPRTKIRPTAHAHPKQGPKELSLPALPPKPVKLRPQSTNIG